MYKDNHVFLLLFSSFLTEEQAANLSSIVCCIVSELNLLSISMNALPS